MPWDNVKQTLGRRYTPDEVKRGMEAMRGERYPEPMTAEIPQGVEAKQNVDKWLTENVVDPLADRGWPNLGAALATPPSVAADLLIPQQGADLAMPGVAKLGRMANKVGSKVAKNSEKLAITYDDAMKTHSKLRDEAGELRSIVAGIEDRLRREMRPGTPDWAITRKAEAIASERYPGFKDARNEIRNAPSMQDLSDEFEAASSRLRPQSRLDDRIGEVERELNYEVSRLKNARRFELDEAHKADVLERVRRLNEKKARLSRQLLKMDGQ